MTILLRAALRMALAAMLVAGIAAEARTPTHHRTARHAGHATVTPAAKAEEPKISASVTMAVAFTTLDESVKCAAPGGDAEKQPEHLYLTVKNDGTVPVTASAARLLAPADMQACADVATQTGARAADGAVALLGPAIGPGRTAVLPLPIGTGATPKTGTTPLLVEIRLHAVSAGKPVDDTVLVSDKVELQVPGLSDALKLFGAPTLFLLPGVIVLGALGLFYRSKESPLLAATGATFWIIAILISVVLSGLYGLVQTLRKTGHNLIDRYDLGDVAIIWTISILLGGIAGWLLQRCADKEAKRVKDAADQAAAGALADAAARMPQHDDSPERLLGRLALLGISPTNHAYGVGGRTGFLLDGRGMDDRWLMPQITHRAQPGAKPAGWDDARNALAAFTDALAVLSPADFLEELKKADYKPLLPLQWWNDVEPYELLVTDALQDEGPLPFVRIR